MNATRINREAQAYQVHQLQAVSQQVTNHQKEIEKKDACRIAETRVARNIRLDRDKGLHVDIDA